MIGIRQELEQAASLTCDLASAPGTSAPVATVRFATGHRVAMIAPGFTGAGPDRRLAELAVFITACEPVAATIAMPGRLRGAGGGDEILRAVFAVSIDVTDGGNRMRAVRWSKQRSTASPVPVTAVPTASLLFDSVVRSRVGVSPVWVAAVLGDRGHALGLTSGSVTEDVDHPLARNPDTAMTLARAKRRVDSLAREFDARHRPTAVAADRSSTPGIPHDLPPGWEPACAV